MQRIILYSLLLVMISACSNSIQFRQPLPPGVTNEKSFPREFRGVYYYNEENILARVTEKGMEYTYEHDSLKGNLSDSLILRKYKDFYFLNVRVKSWESKEKLWKVYLLRYFPDKKRVSFRYVPENVKEDTVAWKTLSMIVNVDSLQGELILNPTLQQLDPLITNTFFNDIHFWKMDENVFLLSNQKVISSRN